MFGKKWMLIISIPLVAMTVLILLWMMSSPSKPTSVIDPIETNQPRDDVQRNPKEEDRDLVKRWPESSGRLDTGSTSSVVVARDEHSVLYVRGHELIHRFYGKEDSVLVKWEKNMKLRHWRNGNTVLLGAIAESTAAEPDPRGMWYSIEFSASSDSQPVFISLGPHFFGPDHILTMKLTSEPTFFFLTMINGDSYSEYVYEPSANEFMTVNANFYRDFEHYAADQPEQVEESIPFTVEKSFDLGTSSVYTFEDERGTIIYFNEPFGLVWRYAGYRPVDFKLFRDIWGKSYPLGRFQDEQGKEMVSFPNSGYSSYMPYDPKLWEGDWTALNFSSFYRVSSSELEVLNFESPAELSNNEVSYKTIDLDSMKLVSDNGFVLEFEKDGRPLFLSVHDLINAEPAFGSTWIYPIKGEEVGRAERPFPWKAESVEKRLPVITHQLNTNHPIPNELYHALGPYTDGGDYGFDIHYRKYGEDWFVLIDARLFAYSGEAVKELGEMPVTLRSRVGEGVSGYTAQDFTKVSGFWYVADTFGDRLIKLNDQLKIVAELPLHLPHQIESLSNGNLRVTSMEGINTVNLDLQIIKSQEIGESKLSPDDMADRHIYFLESYYEDAKLGAVWFAEGELLYRYHKESETLKQFYTGVVTNAYARIKLLPVGDELLAVYDDRTYIFDRKGTWKRTIHYPRENPDGIYTTTTAGENTHYFNQIENKLYLVQGYRVLEIDLSHNTVKTVFRQPFANLGKLLYADGNLYLTLYPNINDRYNNMPEEKAFFEKHAFTEIVKLNLKSGKAKRYFTTGTFKTDRITAGESPRLVLWIFDQPTYTTNQGTSKSYPLSEF